MKKHLNANEFAQMFVEDIPDILKDGKKHILSFLPEIFKDDPELKVLQKAVAEAGYSLKLNQDTKDNNLQEWILSK